MQILEARSIQKSYGTKTVLDFDRFTVYEGDKIGVVGLNGAGKSTLLGILSGELEPDTGEVTRHCRCAMIRQLAEGDATRSGGQNAKAQIQREVGQENTVIFADEPTANLDREGVQWVQKLLRSARTVLLISHDRDLLDALCTRIVEVRDGGLHCYTGNYSDYRRMAKEELARREEEYLEYRQKKAQLESAVQRADQTVSRMYRSKKAQYRNNCSEARLGIDKRKAKIKRGERTSKVLEARLDRLEQVEKPRDQPKITMDFSLTHPPGNKIVVAAEHLEFAYGDHVVFRDASFEIKNGAKLAITGKNGSGKTTLLRLVQQSGEGIRRAPKLRTGLLHQGFENLDLEKTVLDNALISAVQDHASVRSVLAGLLFRRDEVYKKAGVLSGGERMRLSLAKLVVSDCNALLLDEPTNYLDIRSMEAVQAVLREYPGTLLVVSHDGRFLQEVCGEELRIENGKAAYVEKETAPVRPVDKIRLELRLTQLVSEISSAAPDQKTVLEQEYQQTLQQLKAM